MRPGGNTPPNFHQVEIPADVTLSHQLQGYGSEGRIQVRLADLIALIQGGGVDLTTITFITVEDESGELPASLHFVDSATVTFTVLGNEISATAIASDITFSTNQVVYGRNTAGGGAGEELTATTILSWIGNTRGQVLYRGAAGWAALSPGTSGQVLTTAGAGADPAWGTAGVSTARLLTAGAGLTGGGDLSADRTFNVGAGTGITVNADDVAISATYNPVGRQTLYIPASAMTGATTNGAAPGQFESGSNKVNIPVLDFDATTAENAWFSTAFPKSWNEGTVTFRAYWFTAGAVTTGIALSLAGVAVADNASLDVALGTAVLVTDDAQGAAGELYVTDESAAVTVGGTPTADKMCLFRVQRVVGDGNDDMTQDMRLVGIQFFYVTDAANDA